MCRNRLYIFMLAVLITAGEALAIAKAMPSMSPHAESGASHRVLYLASSVALRLHGWRAA